MLEIYFKSPATIDRIRAGWLASEIESYVQWLYESGYAPASVLRRVPLLCEFAEFAKARGATTVMGAEATVEAFVGRRLERRLRERVAPPSEAYCSDMRNPIRQMLRLATKGEVVTQRKAKPFPFRSEAPGYRDHLEQERGLKAASIYQHGWGLRRFAGYLAGVGAGLTQTSPALLADFVADCAPSMSVSSLRNACRALRSFLRYGFREGLLREDLSTAVELPQTYRLAALPRSIGWGDVQRMLACVDRRTAIGRRDYAMLLLLSTYGLRAGEVARLTLDDIDWKHDLLRIRKRKANNATVYPLATEVAEALVEYLRSGRPTTQHRRVFLRAVAPLVPIESWAVSVRAAKYLRRAGIDVHLAGAHTLRHACVQRLVDARFPFKTVADYVGHTSSDSTATYAKLDLGSLLEVAMGHGEQL
ncbi:MAG: site-specific integrase [Bryobacterales bacterium]|nr:site-specific integrase [Bryobacterales bacterium]